jgi:predicted transposase YdaD
VHVLVLVFDRDVARWARQPYTFGEGIVYRPAVIGPDELPEIASMEEALAAPSLAILTALAHLSTRDESAALARQDEIVRVFEAILRADATRFQKKCLSLLHGVARKSTRGILEGLMEEFGMGALDLIRAEGVAEGRAEGVAEGRAEGEAKGGAKMLVEVLRARGVSLSASAEQRILATGDLATLERWMHRALAARTIDEVLD